MWFKQLAFYQLSENVDYDVEKLEEQLAALSYTPCLPSLPLTTGWVAPIGNEHSPLVHAANGYLLFCMQIEEKVLPAVVVRQELNERINTINETRDRKISQKEKLSLKDEIIQSLLPRAFSKLSRVYAYIDTRKQWLIVDAASSTKLEKFRELFKRSIDNVIYSAFETKKISSILTNWLLQDDLPRSLTIDKSCVLVDPNQQSRVIRCQQQELTASAIQLLLKDGCEVHQLSLSWQNKLSFSLSEDFTVKSIKYDDEVLSMAKDNYSESPEQQFDADFYIMTELLSEMITFLLRCFSKNEKTNKRKAALEAVLE